MKLLALPLLLSLFTVSTSASAASQQELAHANAVYTDVLAKSMQHQVDVMVQGKTVSSCFDVQGGAVEIGAKWRHREVTFKCVAVDNDGFKSHFLFPLTVIQHCKQASPSQQCAAVASQLDQAMMEQILEGEELGSL
ncbi:MAG: hypothetical protein ACPG4U_11080 [Pseudomonadales bacterium]